MISDLLSTALIYIAVEFCLSPKKLSLGAYLNYHLEELNRLLVGETSCLGVVLSEQDGSDSPNS